jgi:hypothetical protein
MKAPGTLLFLSVLLSSSLGEPALAQIIDHRAIPGAASLPQTTVAQIAALRWYFIHASVGDNILQGLRDLNRTDAVGYPLVVSTLPENASAPDATVAGTVYEHHFTSDKMPQFRFMVNSNGWHKPAVDVALMKFCYLEGLATSLTPGPQLAAQYVAMMAALEQAHPDTVFVYASMPLLIYRAEGDPRGDPTYLASIVNINQFNDWLRAYCRTNSKLLYDLADMESHDPEGHQATFIWTNSQSYPVIHAPYVYNTNNPPGANSGHLIAPGRQQVAKGWYAMAAAVVSNQAARPSLGWSREAHQLRLAWPGSGFILQRNTNLAQPSDWRDVPGADQGAHLLTNTNAPVEFFRLRKQ